MKNVLPAIILSFALIFTGCVASLNPMYRDRDLIFDHTLIGTWVEPGGRETWEFGFAGDNKYKLVHTDEDGKKGEFEARLFLLGDNTFLDISPAGTRSPQNDFHKGHVIGGHSFVRVLITGKKFAISYLEPKWLKQFLTKNPGAIAHSVIDGEILFTDSTENLQKFISANIDTPEAFSSPLGVERKEASR